MSQHVGRHPELLIVLQSHSLSDNQVVMGIVPPDRQRYVGRPKSEVARVCTRSLAGSIAECREEYPEARIRFHVIDDHSDEEFVTHVKQLLANLQEQGIETSFETLNGRGLLASCLAQYTYGREHGNDLVYFAQDDYLYYPNAITQMVEMYTGATMTSGRHVSIFPYNHPYKYSVENSNVPCYILQGKDRYWRTSLATACCFMTHVSIIRDNWDVFYDFCHHAVDGVMEDETINKLFQRRGHVLLTPLPSLALHLQYESDRDPFLDWQALWSYWDGLGHRVGDDPFRKGSS
jgi:hypothetical protein